MKLEVLCNDRVAGILEKNDSLYKFSYNDAYINDISAKSLSLTLPKSQKQFTSNILFPFFYGLLTEGVSCTIQCRKLKLDENDYFSRLAKTVRFDSIGCVTVREIS